MNQVAFSWQKMCFATDDSKPSGQDAYYTYMLVYMCIYIYICIYVHIYIYTLISWFYIHIQRIYIIIYNNNDNNNSDNNNK